MYIVFFHEDRHMALVGQTRGVCKAMEVCLLDIKFPRLITKEAHILLSNQISLFNNLNIMGYVGVLPPSLPRDTLR
jgi:hypothetical protein